MTQSVFAEFFSGRNDGDKLQDDLNKLFQWSRIWVMEFNAERCKVLRVARIRSIDDWDYIYYQWWD